MMTMMRLILLVALCFLQQTTLAFVVSPSAVQSSAVVLKVSRRNEWKCRIIEWGKSCQACEGASLAFWSIASIRRRPVFWTTLLQVRSKHTVAHVPASSTVGASSRDNEAGCCLAFQFFLFYHPVGICIRHLRNPHIPCCLLTSIFFST